MVEECDIAQCYKRGIMAEEKDSNKVIPINSGIESDVSNNDDKKNQKKSKKFWKILKKKGIGVIGLAIAVILGETIPFYLKYSRDLSNMQLSFSNDVKNLQDALDRVEHDQEAMASEIKTLSSDVSELKGELKGLNYFFDIFREGSTANASATDVAKESLAIDITQVDNARYLSTPKWQAGDVLLRNEEDSFGWTAEALVGDKLFIPYMSGDSYVLFMGQFNESNHWDGECILNVYDGNQNLTRILEAEYSDGKIESFSQALPDEKKNGDEVWTLSYRTVDEYTGEYIGETYNYFRYSDISMKFEFADAARDDLITVESFKEEYATEIESYYNGNTKAGYYNDVSGQAILVEYFKDGTVRLVYQGKFLNGKLEDWTGNAWYIVRNTDTLYMYYKGYFENDTPAVNRDQTNSEQKHGISVERIERILEDNGVDFPTPHSWADGGFENLQ